MESKERHREARHRRGEVYILPHSVSNMASLLVVEDATKEEVGNSGDSFI